ncbi:MAG: hypothetical protein ABIY55_35140 [Kofleriaceae bacterium]
MKISETACPFCGGALADLTHPSRFAPAARLGRAAVFAFGLTTAQGCGDDVVTRLPVDAALDAALDAAPDAALDAAPDPAPDAAFDDGGVPIYAAAPTPDAGPKRG